MRRGIWVIEIVTSITIDGFYDVIASRTRISSTSASGLSAILNGGQAFSTNINMLLVQTIMDLQLLLTGCWSNLVQRVGRFPWNFVLHFRQIRWFLVCSRKIFEYFRCNWADCSLEEFQTMICYRNSRGVEIFLPA